MTVTVVYRETRNLPDARSTNIRQKKVSEKSLGGRDPRGRRSVLNSFAQKLRKTCLE